MSSNVTIYLEEHLDWPQVWLSAQQRGVDGVYQQRPGTSGGFLAAWTLLESSKCDKY